MEPTVPKAKFPVPLAEALRRLAEGDPIECMIEFNGVTQPLTQPREHVVKVLEQAAQLDAIEESGYLAQRSNLGLHVYARHPLYGYGWMFISTKPECRVPDEVIEQREQEEAERMVRELAESFAEAKKIGASPAASPKDYN